MSCDGTDFKIAEYGPKFSSHKYAKKSALKYEVCLCILTGDIVWINGPYLVSVHSIVIFRDCLLSHLADNERVEADDGYIGEAPYYVKCPKCITNPQETLAMQARIRSRQETVNGRFKNWGVLRQRYRHEIIHHGDHFRCVAVLTQLSINAEEKLFSTGYRDPPYTNTAYDVESDDDDDDDL